MKFRLYAALLAALVWTAACGGEKAGVPETETTGTAQSVSETSTASATTTGATGGSITALSNEDKEFASNAGMDGLFEVQAGNLAVQKASSAEVKAFAQRMVTDHSKASDELSQLATAKGLALPTELDGDHKAALDHLNALSGAEFDKAYMAHMVDDHQKAAAELEKASASATDSDLKTWAAKTVPLLHDHHNLASSIAQRLK